MTSFDLIGNIAILKFKDESQAKKKKIAQELIEKNKNITTILEKTDKVKGRLRTLSIKHLAGIKTTIATYKENGCLFKLDIEKCYFSPRLAEERKQLALSIKPQESVLVMFSGIGVYPIIISKLANPKQITAIELGKTPHKYAAINLGINKINNITLFQGSVKKIIPILEKQRIKFDRIVMPRPQLKDTFLQQAFAVSKKNTVINYYCFFQESEIQDSIEKIETETKTYGRRIEILNVKKAGDISPYKYRWRIDLKIL